MEGRCGAGELLVRYREATIDGRLATHHLLDDGRRVVEHLDEFPNDLEIPAFEHDVADGWPPGRESGTEGMWWWWCRDRHRWRFSTTAR